MKKPITINLKMQKKKILNYLIIIEPDERIGTNEPCFSVYCPILGLADSGETIEEAMVNMTELIKFHLDCLSKEGESIPVERPEKGIIGTLQVPLPKLSKLIPA